jgi:identified by metaGeneAnnotator
LQFGLWQGFGCLIPFVTSGIAEFVGNGRSGLDGISAELLRCFPLQVDLFGHRVFVEAVFQMA